MITGAESQEQSILQTQVPPKPARSSLHGGLGPEEGREGKFQQGLWSPQLISSAPAFFCTFCNLSDPQRLRLYMGVRRRAVQKVVTTEAVPHRGHRGICN